MHIEANEAVALPTANGTTVDSAPDHASDPGRPRRENAAAPPPEPTWRAALQTLAVNVRQPEQRLILAVLEDALDTLLQSVATGGHGRRLVAATETWLAADNYDWPFSFVSICEALDLDAGRVRRWVENHRRDRLEAEQPARPLRLLVSPVLPTHARWASRASAFRFSCFQP